MADRSDATFKVLKEKQPSPCPDSYIPLASVINGPLLSVPAEDVAQDIRSFPNGSAVCLDELRQPHLKYMTNSPRLRSSILKSWPLFLPWVLEGKTPSIIHLFFGATPVTWG